jgi:hypothetical protein
MHIENPDIKAPQRYIAYVAEPIYPERNVIPTPTKPMATATRDVVL